MTTRVWTTEEIKALLTAASPAPWQHDHNLIWKGGEVICQFWDKEEWEFQNHRANAALVGAAPEIIQQLLNHLERLADQVLNWTPVTRSPTESGTYLVIMAGFPVVLFYNAEEGFWDDDEQTDALITHWMPIPTTPEDA